VVSNAERLVTSLVTYVEARAALAAAHRARRLSRAGVRRSRLELESRYEESSRVVLSAQLVHQAGDVAERRGLRAKDAIHLASALAVGIPGLVVLSYDSELRTAAREEGFAVAP
jgi:uncharacterized protein